MAANERDMGRILEALEQGKRDRADLRESLDETKEALASLRETIAEMRVEFMLMNQRAEQASLLGSRVTLLEGRIGTVANDLQALQSFITMAKSWSIKTVVGILLALVLGVSTFSKLIEWGLFKFGLR